jgi:hypothetical protein
MVAIVVCGKNAKMDIGHDNVVLEGDGWWSGWTSVSGKTGPQEVFADVGRPEDELLDLLLLARGADHDLVFDGVVRWERFECVIAGGRNRAANTLEITNAASTALPPKVLEKGILLTDVSRVDFEVFRPGNPTLLHPVHGDTSLVHLPCAVVAGTKGVRSIVSVGDERAHPVQFAMWINRGSQVCTSVADLERSYLFSGWFTVSNCHGRHQFSVLLPTPAEEDMDLYIGTRVVDRENVYFCSAEWHELLLLN